MMLCMRRIKHIQNPDENSLVNQNYYGFFFALCNASFCMVQVLQIIIQRLFNHFTYEFTRHSNTYRWEHSIQQTNTRLRWVNKWIDYATTEMAIKMAIKSPFRGVARERERSENQTKHLHENNFVREKKTFFLLVVVRTLFVTVCSHGN